MMKGLITKEILVLIKNNKVQFFCILLFAVLGIATKRPSYIMFIPLLLPMLVKQSLAVDETSKWDKYSVCFPVNRKKIVSSKYIVVFFAALTSFAIAVLSFILMNTINKERVISNDDILVYIAMTTSLSIILPSMTYPFDFKFGTAKGRLIYFIITGVAVAGLSALFVQSDLPSFITKLTQPTVIGAVFAAALIIFTASWFISARIYESREI